uniref:Uncharacterized protein n=1 Tax=viral metagenome TaxID=1070528 RepID=A0A6M3LX92_9ZZZZ
MRKGKLIPPDKKQCQGEHLIGGAFSLGRPYYQRCKNKPVVIIVETKKPYGSMSVCAECLEIAGKQLNNKFTIKSLSGKIKEVINE